MWSTFAHGCAVLRSVPAVGQVTPLSPAAQHAPTWCIEPILFGTIIAMGVSEGKGVGCAGEKTTRRV